MKLKKSFLVRKTSAAGNKAAIFLALSSLFFSCVTNNIAVPVPGQNAKKTNNIYAEYYTIGDTYFKLEDYKKAAELNHSKAFYNLGVIYQNGFGVPINYLKAREYFEKAANLNDSDALYNLGLLYQNGNGVTINYSKAIEYYEKAASLNNLKAILNLRILHQFGYRTQNNYSKTLLNLYKKAF